MQFLYLHFFGNQLLEDYDVILVVLFCCFLLCFLCFLLPYVEVCTFEEVGAYFNLCRLALFGGSPSQVILSRDSGQVVGRLESASPWAGWTGTWVSR